MTHLSDELNSANIQNVYRLSPMQEGIYFHSLIDTSSQAYFCQSRYEIGIPIDPTVLEQSLQYLIARHDVLRTVFSHQKTDEPIQVVLRSRSCQFYFEDLRHAAEPNKLIDDFQAADRGKGFDLRRDLLIRLAVFRYSDVGYALIWSHHHIILDGWCSAMLMKELLDIYLSLAAGSRPAVRPAGQYGDYIAWLHSRNVDQAAAFWRERLRGFSTVTGLPDRMTNSAAPRRFETLDLSVTPLTTAALRMLGRRIGVTLNCICQAAWSILLSRVNHSTEVTFGAVMSVRPPELTAIEHTLGLFINTLPVRVVMDTDRSFRELAKLIQQQQLDAQPHQFFPLNRMAALAGRTDTLFDHVLIMENFPAGDSNGTSAGAPGDNHPAASIRFDSAFSETNYDFNLIFLPGSSLVIRFNYNTGVYSPIYINAVRDAFDALLQQAAADPDRPVPMMALTIPAQVPALLNMGRGERVHYRALAMEIFGDWVAARPHSIALLDPERKEISYKELDGLVQRVGSALRQQGCERGAAVGVLCGPGLQTVVSLLAIWRAGGVYVPLDPALPPERLRFIMRDAGISILVTIANPGIPDLGFAGPILFADADPILADAATDTGLPMLTSPANEGDALAYIIYTSGTSGKPKVVPIRQHSIAARAVYHRDYLRLGPGDRILQFAAVAFDASIIETVMTLLSGATLVLIDKQQKDNTELLVAVMRTRKVTTAIFPPAYLRLLADVHLSHWTKIISTGEAAILPLMISLSSNRTVLNGYGPTEACIGATFHRVDPDRAAAGGYGESLPIGKPFSNTDLYIIDRFGHLLPAGLSGELCIAGPGLSPGYIGLPELTKEKFTPNPFNRDPDYALLYHTGDQCRWNASGELEYLGRIDAQIQIRGIRVEPAETEQLLRQHPAVADVTVQALAYGDEQRLVAYIVPAQGPAGMAAPELRSFLQSRLPAYMLPWRFVWLSALPLTGNGKIDRQGLPEPGPVEEEGREMVKASGDREERLLWALEGVLGRKGLSMGDDFFGLGGDSIRAIQVSSRLYREGWELEVKDIFGYPVLSEMAGRMRPLQGSIDQGPVEGLVPLSPIQREFFGRGLLYPHHYNQSLLLRSERRLEADILRRVLEELHTHHDALRMLFRRTSAGWEQYNRAPGVAVEVRELDVSDRPAGELTGYAQQVQESLLPETGPLLKAVIFHTADGDRLLLVAHHLVVDGVSWRILLEDLGGLYDQALQGAALRLPPKTDSFRAWSEALAAEVKTEGFAERQSYWRRRKDEEDQEVEEEEEGEGEWLSATGETGLRVEQFGLDEEQTEQLLREVNGVYHTEINDILLSALSLAWREAYGRRRVRVMLEGHGRQGGPGLKVSRTVGWFTTVYPVWLDSGEEEDTGAVIRGIKEQLRAIPDKGIGYGLLRYLYEGGETLTAGPASIVFNYLGQLDQDVTGNGFALATENPGNNIHTDEKAFFPLSISVRVSASKLHVQFRYDAALIARDSIRALTTGFHRCLTGCIDHCLRADFPMLTASDLIGPVCGPQDAEGIKDRFLETLQRRYQTRFGAAVTDIYPLSPMQEGMLFHHLMDKESKAYIYQLSFEILGIVDPSLAREAMAGLVRRHDILRTVFDYTDTDHLLQVVLEKQPLDFTCRRLDEGSADTLDANIAVAIAAAMAADRDRAFDPGTGPLFRLSLLSAGPDRWILIWTCHHLLMDGWCMSLLVKEFRQRYAALAEALPFTLPPAVPYRRYMEWLTTAPIDQALAYWQDELTGYQSDIVIEHLTPTAPAAYDPAIFDFALTKRQSAALREMAARSRVTSYIFFQALWGILLARYNRTTDIVFGTIISGRPPQVRGIEQMIGLFINMIPVRVQCGPDKTVSALLTELQDRARASEAHQYCPLARVRATTPLREHPITHFIEMDNFPVDTATTTVTTTATATATAAATGSGSAAAGDQWQVRKLEAHEFTHYDFSLMIHDGDHFGLSFHYNRNKYTGHHLLQLADHFVFLLEQVLADRWIQLSEMRLNRPQEMQKLLELSMGATRSYPTGEGFVRLFEHRVNEMPAGVAVTDGIQTLTYRQLWAESLAVAARLRASDDLPPELPFAVSMERSVQLAATVIGIWMAGGVYLPMDPQLPAERMQFMLKDAGARWPDRDSDRAPISSAGPAATLPVQLTGHSLAYILYTSGSTGTPKGVMIEQGSMLNHLMAKIDDLEIDREARVAQTAGISFDISIWQLLAALLAGGTVRIFSQPEVLDIGSLIGHIRSEKITHWQVAPVYLAEVLNILEEQPELATLTDLRYMIATGEELKPALLGRWLRLFPGIPLVNAYGPTEASDDVTHAFLSRIPTTAHVPIGSPLNNVHVYVAEDNGQLCPVGIPGEIIVGGDAVGRGYLRGDPAKKFSSALFYRSARTYRTGDLGIRLPDGQIVFLGRSDDQIKIHGHRIEPGEIERMLATAPGIAETAVTAIREGDHYRLLAYIQWRPGHDRDIAGLKTWLQERLTFYMIPSAFVELDRFPVTVNGKIDRRRLPVPDAQTSAWPTASNTNFNLTEALLSAIWKQVLGQAAASADTNFFAAGGDSIRAIQISSRLHGKGYRLDVRDVFEAPTLSAMALRLRPLATAVNSVSLSGELPLTPIQQRFFTMGLKTPSHYNQSLLLSFQNRQDRGSLQQIADYLFQYHDMLRTQFRIDVSGRVIATMLPSWSPEIRYFDWRDNASFQAPLDSECAAVQSDMALDYGGLARLALFSLPEEDCLLLVFHHLVIDGVSWRILLEDLMTLWRQSAAGEPLQLPARTSSFRDWSMSLQRYAHGKSFIRERKYWQPILARHSQLLPCSGPAPTTETATATLSFDKALTGFLLKEANSAYRTDPTDLLLTTVGLAVRDGFGLQQFCVDMERHGREELYPDLNFSRTVGWFTSIFPVFFDLAAPRSTGEHIRAVQAGLRAIPRSGIGFGILRYGMPEPAGPMSAHAEIVFNYLGQFDREIDDDICRVAPYAAGPNSAPEENKAYRINVAALVVQGALTVKVEYDSRHLGSSQVTLFIRALESTLALVLDACRQKQPVAALPAQDFGYPEISEKDLSMINDLFN